ncbi:imelysin family protein [Roseiterribacter gracilis]|uniref:Lipoprotein n=1 Tax=Roseiterribacter gracilis TaxID=2812848 RepID=A0A8S8X5W9_9PROT|nr:lipoprotein precursor [Rhodospirillales bacterium TMPK1]
MHRRRSFAIQVGLVALAISAFAVPAVAQQAATKTAKTTKATKAAPAAAKPVSFDAKPQLAAYAQLAAESYAQAATESERLKRAVDEFLKTPSDAALNEARAIWVNARPSWLRTLAFRFAQGPVDVVDAKAGSPARRIDAWPIDDSSIDYVEANPTAGLINDTKVALTRDELIKRSLAEGRSGAVLGWHAVEFLLWGQDMAPYAPGQRAYTDFLAGQVNNDRRRAYLKLATDQLVDDLKAVAAAWDAKAKQSYTARFLLLSQREALSNTLTGLARTAYAEIAGRAIATPLDSGDQRDESSDASDTSDRDISFALRGIRAVWTGEAPTGTQRAGFDQLVARVDPALAARVTATLHRAENAVAAIEVPFDRTITAPVDSAMRQKAEAAITALRALGTTLREAGTRLGATVQVEATTAP